MSYVALATVTLTGPQTVITFSSIPATFKDLVLVYAGTQTNASGEVYIRYNSDTGSNYTTVQMGGYGSGSGFESDFTTNRIVPAANVGESTTIISNFVFTVLDYSATNKHKTSLLRMNTSSRGVNAQANRWANTNAINTITAEAGFAGQLATGTTISLYGVA